mgnify:CR=1 FL=1
MASGTFGEPNARRPRPGGRPDEVVDIAELWQGKALDEAGGKGKAVMSGLTGLRGALTRTINDYARKNNLLKDNDSNFSGEDTREGLTAIVSIKHPDPQFESQTKVKLMNAELGSLTKRVAE